MKKRITICLVKSKKNIIISTMFSLLFSFSSSAQVFWTENFNNGCTGQGAPCGNINAYIGGPNGPWTSTLGAGNTGTDPNTFYVSCTENGNPVGVGGTSCGGAATCGVASPSNATLHVGNISTSPLAGFACPTGDCGAAYDAGFIGGAVETDIRAESPTINCTGHTGISINFNYMLGGDLGVDYGEVVYSDDNGVSWYFLASPNITALCGGAQGEWASYTFALPATCDNNPFVKIGFHWVNNDDGTGTDPSFAIDDVTLSTAAANTITTSPLVGPFCACSTINVPFTSTGTFNAGNVYKAELSDVTGSFTTFALIGTLNSTANSGTISCTIPCNTPAGSNYFIRIVATSPATTGTANLVPFTINAQQDASFIYSSSSYCQAGTNPSASITGVAGGTFTSTPAGLVINASTGLITLATSAINTYTVTYTTAGPCPGTFTATISITGSPVATFNYPLASYCTNVADPSPVYTGGGTAGNYTVAPLGLVFISAGTGQVDVSASVPGTYTVTNDIPVNGGCAAATASTTITINAVQDSTFSYPTGPTFCQSGTNPSPTILGTAGGTFTATPVGLSINAVTGVINLAGSTLGTYNVTYTTPGPCATFMSQSVTITLAPVATFNYTASPYCQSATNPVPTYTGGGSAGTFTSAPGGLTFVAGGTAGEVDLINSAAGTYTVTNTIAASGGCPVATSTATITIIATPAANFSYIGSPYCSAGLNPSPTFSNGGIAGTFTATPVGLNIVANTGAITLNSSTPGTYSVTNTIVNAGCPNSVFTSSVQIISAPVATFSYTGTPYCINGGTATPTFSGGGVAGAFTSTPAGLVINAVTGAVTLATSTAGTYTVTNSLAATSSCPAVSAISTIVVNASPTVTVNSGTICAGDTIHLTAAGATSYTWSAGATSTGTTTAIAFPVTTTSYTVTGTVGSCTGTAVATVTISAQLPVTVNSPTICNGQTATLTAGGATTYTWSAGATSSGVTTATASPVATASYTVTGHTGNCTGTAVAIVTVQVCVPPVADFAASPLYICTSGCTTFYDSSSSNTTNWLWQFPGGIPSTSTSQNPGQVCYSAVNDYTVMLTVMNAQGDTSTLIMPNYIHVVDPIQVHITGNTMVNTCESTDLTAQPAGSSYLWGELLASGINTIACGTCQTATITPSFTDTYFVQYRDVNGCASTDTTAVTITSIYTYFMPTGFSPNADNINDELIVHGRGIESINLKIFDRIGEKVFETSSWDSDKKESAGWDGKYHGILMNEGVYVYELTVTYCNQQTEKANGNVNLVK